MNVCYTGSEDLGQQHPSLSLRLESLATHDDNKIKSHNVNFSSDALDKHRDPGGLTGDTAPIKNECQHSLWADDCERLVRRAQKFGFSPQPGNFPRGRVSKSCVESIILLHVHSVLLQLNYILTSIAVLRDARVSPSQEPNNLGQGYGSLTAQEAIKTIVVLITRVKRLSSIVRFRYPKCTHAMFTAPYNNAAHHMFLSPSMPEPYPERRGIMSS